MIGVTIFAFILMVSAIWYMYKDNFFKSVALWALFFIFIGVCSAVNTIQKSHDLLIQLTKHTKTP